MREVELFVTDRVDLVSEILFKLTHLEMLEDINVWFQPRPYLFKDNYHITIYFTGDTEEEIEFKRKMIWDAVQEFIDSKDGGFMGIEFLRDTLLEMPQRGSPPLPMCPRGRI